MESDLMQWQCRVPIFRHPVILKQLGLAIGIPFGTVALIIALTSGQSIYALYGLGLMAALLFLSWLLMMILYRGHYEAEFMLDHKGARCRTQAGQAKKNLWINRLTIGLGLMTGRPSSAGAGMLAQSRQDVFLTWESITKVSFRPKSQTILLRGGWTENIALFCTAENYEQVERTVRQRIPVETGVKHVLP